MLSHFERRDPERNIARFYSLHIQPTLFGEWDLLRTWGRIGSAGRLLINHHPDAGAAERAAEKLIRRRLRHGYRQRA